MDSPLTTAADALLVKVSPPALVNHCRRTFAFASELLRHRARAYDDEALYVASMLHDLGLTDTYEDGVTPFEERGAQVAEALLVELDAPDRFTELVRDAIALHLEVATAKDPRPEVAGVSLGAAVDVLGLRIDHMTKSFVAEVLETYPRQGFKALVLDAIARQAELKPASRAAQYITQYQFLDMIRAAPFED